MTECFADTHTADTVPVYIAGPDGAQFVKTIMPDDLIQAASGRDFTGQASEVIILRNSEGGIIGVLAGAGAEDNSELGVMHIGHLPRALPAGRYMIAEKPVEWDWQLTAIAWGLGSYKFTRYLGEREAIAQLVLTGLHSPDETRAIVSAINNGRDLINTPAGDMGPAQLDAETQAIANRYGAQITSTVGQALLDDNLPMIHAVGRAAHEAPRLIEFVWGDPKNPKLTLVGKGITFDTGGLNIKSAAGARIMKKDMGGAAHALTLADMIMAADLPVHLHVLIAIAENAISAGAYRPGDVLQSREGLTVEIDNTDAEGRLVLGDALSKGAESRPDLMIDFATLTGAARVALGPTLPPFFCNTDAMVPAVLDSASQNFDPVWYMPLWSPYMKYLASPIADMKNSGSSFGGAITAGLFLQKFVKDTPWMHFDVYGWNPARTDFGTAGGEIFAVRALYEWIKKSGLPRRANEPDISF